MFTSLKEISKLYKVKFNEFDLQQEVEILKLCNDNLESINTTTEHKLESGTSEILCLIGFHYQYTLKNYQEMTRHYLTAIGLKHADSSKLLGDYYLSIKKYKLMKKYYLIAIDLGSTGAMNSMAEYYENININPEEMEKYLLMSLHAGDNDALDLLIYYHRYVSEDYKKLEEYYSIAVEMDDCCMIGDYADYLKNIIKNYFLAEKYFIKSIEGSRYQHFFSLLSYANFHRDITKKHGEMIKYYQFAFESCSEIFIENIEKFYDNDPIEYFKLLYNLNIDNEILSKKLDEISKCKEIQHYINFSMEPVKHTNTIFTKLYNNYVSENIRCINGYISDFKIVAISEEFSKEYFIHSLVLNSEYFHTLIDGDFKKSNEITMNVDTFETIDDLLKYLYLKEINFKNMNPKRIENLLKIADEFMFNELKKLCEIYIKYSEK